MKNSRLMSLAFGALITLAFLFGAVSPVRATTYYVDWNNMSPVRPYTNSVGGAARIIEVVLPYAQDGVTNLLDGFEAVPFDMPYPQANIELVRPTNNILPAVFYKINVRKND